MYNHYVGQPWASAPGAPVPVMMMPANYHPPPPQPPHHQLAPAHYPQYFPHLSPFMGLPPPSHLHHAPPPALPTLAPYAAPLGYVHHPHAGYPPLHHQHQQLSAATPAPIHGYSISPLPSTPPPSQQQRQMHSMTPLQVPTPPRPSQLHVGPTTHILPTPASAVMIGESPYGGASYAMTSTQQRTTSATVAAAAAAAATATTSTNHNTRASRRRKGRGGRQVHVRLYAGSSVVHIIPGDDVFHLPEINADPETASVLYLCRAYDPVVGPQSCPDGSRCPFVHADLSRSVRHLAHDRTMASRQQLTECPYPRFEVQDGEPPYFSVAAPNRTDLFEIVPREAVLKTKALESGRSPLSHCVHFQLKGVCDLGAECFFIHAVVPPTQHPPPSGNMTPPN
jgi:hypothetical protein